MADIPKAGDIHWVEFDPVLGTEQAGRRPAIVLTDASYHALSNRALVCPISRRARDWPFEVPLAAGLKTRGVVLVDQARAVHRASRIFAFIESVPLHDLAQIRGRLAALIGIDLGARETSS